MTGSLTRRDLVRTGIGGAAALAGAGALGRFGSGLDAALAAPARCGRLSDIEHVVILVQENRSFDHYFGTYRGVRGFDDPRVRALHDGSGKTVFAQPGYDVPGYGGHLNPFHVDSRHNGECTNDLTHEWGPQHRSWNRGRMDGFLREHLDAEGPERGPITMGYYQRSDLPFYYALADAFTVCDRFHCSVIGPTDPNNCYAIAATIDPAGRHGGPMMTTVARLPTTIAKLSMTTMPEQLRERGISWKIYSAPDGVVDPLGDSPIPLFKQYWTDPELLLKGQLPVFPLDLQRDAARGELPQVSWVWAPLVMSEHPPTPVTWGEWVTDTVLRALTANPDVWSKTVLFMTWDENGGYFDHVPPPVAPRGTAGEWITAPELPEVAEGVRGPIGLGFRVPAMVVSPFSRGGLVCSDVFDHTSMLQFIERRFGAEVPNLSEWRRSVTGDLTSALNLAARPDRSIPSLPRPSLTDSRVLLSDCLRAPLTAAGEVSDSLRSATNLPPYPVPPNSTPHQEPGRPRRPSGPCRRR